MRQKLGGNIKQGLKDHIKNVKIEDEKVEKTFQLKMSLVCTDCFFHAEIIMHDLQVIQGVLAPRIQNVLIEGTMKGAMNFTWELVLSPKGLNDAQDIKLWYWPIPSLTGKEFKIGGVTVGLAAQINLNLHYGFMLAGIIKINFGGRIDSKFALSITDEKHTNIKLSANSFVPFKPTYTIEAKLSLMVGIKVQLEINLLGLIVIRMFILPNFNLVGSFRFPPTPFPRTKLTKDKGIFLLGKKNCEIEHLAEYELLFKLDYHAEVQLVGINLFKKNGNWYNVTIVYGCAFQTYQDGFYVDSKIVLQSNTTQADVGKTKLQIEREMKTTIEKMLQCTGVQVYVTGDDKGMVFTISVTDDKVKTMFRDFIEKDVSKPSSILHTIAGKVVVVNQHLGLNNGGITDFTDDVN